MCRSRSRTSNGVVTDVIVADRRRAAAFIFVDVYSRVNEDADRRPIIARVIVPDDTTLTLFEC